MNIFIYIYKVTCRLTGLWVKSHVVCCLLYEAPCKKGTEKLEGEMKQNWQNVYPYEAGSGHWCLFSILYILQHV